MPRVNALPLRGFISENHYHCMFDAKMGLPWPTADGFYLDVTMAGKHIFGAACQADADNMLSLTAAYGARFKDLMSLLYNNAPQGVAYAITGLLILGYTADRLLQVLTSLPKSRPV